MERSLFLKSGSSINRGLKLGESLNIFYAKQEDACIVTIKNKDDDKLNCIVKMY